MQTKQRRGVFAFALLSLWATGAFAQTDITDLGGTVSAQYNDSPTAETIVKLTDNTTSTKYLTFHNAGWVQYQVSQPYVVTKYSISSANDSPERDPKSWTLQGSNDGTSWTTINTQSNQSFATRLLRQEYSFTNTVGYSQYRMNLTNTSGTILQLSEWELFGVLDIKDITNLPGTISAQYSDSPAAEGIANVIDNQSSTKYLTFHGSGWIQFASINPSIITSYTITSANDADERDPQNWTLQGSPNGTTWTTLDTRSNEDFPTRFLKKTYSFVNTTAYTTYRLSMISNVTTTTTTGGGTDVCASVAQYVENGGYVAGSNVKNAGKQYQCKDYPYSGWCNGAAWAYAPGTGSYWSDAWVDKGSCGTSGTTTTTTASTILQLAEWELFGTGGGGTTTTTTITPPPTTWKEHWFDHTQLLSRVYYDNDIAVYFDSDVNSSLTWMDTYLADVWKYTKQTYGKFGGADTSGRLFTVFHTNKYSGGHPSTYFDASHDFRNVIDVGPGPWTNGTGNDLDLTTHEVGHIVEGASKNIHGSPSFNIWMDSKWNEIYIYDVYNGLNRTADVTRWYNLLINGSDNFPRANSFWFRDWFYPIYHTYGGKEVLNNYFTLLSQCFVKNGNSYARDLNWGEFVHFWSGAAGTNLKPLATNAFGWPADWETQFRKAQIDFPCVTYSNAAARIGDDVATEEVSVWYNMDAKVVTVADETVNTLNGDVTIYSLLGVNVLKADLKTASDVATVDASRLTQGMYVVVVNSNGKTFKKNILVK